ncbi:MAG TPA: SIS domain-containing protein [Kiritimatiellia bacterium]|nr:SIS domain-containing protein [Kiritimatiellia bacterium]
MEVTKQYLEEVIDAARSVDLNEVSRLVDLLEQTYRSGRDVFVIGNGGSASNASHFAQDLSKGSIPDMEGKRFRVTSFTDNVATITAISNDIGYERIFDLQLRQYARPNDVLVAISGSGNSRNIIRAAEYARDHKLTIVGVTGFNGGQLLTMSDIRIHVPINDMCKAEAVHSIVLHMASEILRVRLHDVRGIEYADRK